MKMKKFLPILSAIVFAGSLAGSALVADGVLFRQDAGDYCHMKFPAIRPRTLDTDHPQLKSANSGDVIDYYGPCEESPTGRDQVIKQQQEEELRFDRNYED
ncbi:MAG TPA: hypothetical protein VNN13_09120 [Methylomirabilota bacterium]|nr:hypothetical protein [Methylomirabilota bacterium]